MTIQRWLLPTNTANLGAMIAQGLISDKQGFKKYYTDILSETAGYIPVIREDDEQGMISDALEMAISEDSGLTPCIIVINLKHITGGEVITDNGDSVNIADIFNWNSETHFPKKILISAPLPLSCITEVLFKTTKEKEEFSHDTKTIYRNIPLNSIKLGRLTNKNVSIFSNADKINRSNLLEIISDSPSTSVIVRDETELHSVATEHSTRTPINYLRTYSLGGLLGALFYYTKNGRLTTDAFHDSCNSNMGNNINIYDYPQVYNYFYPRDTPLTSISTIKMMFNKILDVIVNSNKNDCKDLIIQLLRSDMLPGDDAFKEKSNQLADDLVAFYRNTSNKNASEIFTESQKPKEKSSIKILLLMLFYREDVEALTEVDFGIFVEEDYILFAMLFGARDKFTGLPKFLREYDGLQVYISNLMAQYAHNSAQTGITFKNVKAPPTIVDMLKPSKLEFISQISKLLDAQDCFISVMPNVDFTNIKCKITYSGIVLPKIVIDQSKFFTKMSSLKIDNKLYNKILQKYRKL